MKIVYRGRKGGWGKPSMPEGEDDCLELLWNDWDDYGYKTSFPTSCRIQGKAVELGRIRLLIEGENRSDTALDKMIADGWDGIFPIPNTKYISVPDEITFYEQIQSLLGQDDAATVAENLKDASYLKNIKDDGSIKDLLESEGFQKSLQRERGSMKSYEDGWRVFRDEEITVADFDFSFVGQSGEDVDLAFRFSNEGQVLPTDINVLIGPNGVGKSQLLHKMVLDWIEPGENDGFNFGTRPNLSQLVVVSYSPFEKFPVDLFGLPLVDQDVYRYFGFRGRKIGEDGGEGSISLSHDTPRRNSAVSLLECFEDDERFHGIAARSGKLQTLRKVILTAFDFDEAVVCLRGTTRIDSLTNDLFNLPSEIEKLSESAPEGCLFVPISDAYLEDLKLDRVEKYLLPEEGVSFIKDGEVIELSSGQRLFAYVVINVLGAIRNNSLILIDEPELFLHPTLEIQFISMLKEVLKAFKSKAILATHSVVTVREIPDQCVHIFQKNDLKETIIVRPPFQTFGGDHQRISSYVFGDNAVSKPFEAWIDEKLREFGSAELLLEALEGQLNEEITIDILAKAKDFD